MGRQSWSKATVFGLDPEVGLGFVWEEQKGIPGSGWHEQACRDRSGRGTAGEQLRLCPD